MNKYANKILNGDAFDWLFKMDDNSVDVIFTDPPYFLDQNGRYMGSFKG